MIMEVTAYRIGGPDTYPPTGTIICREFGPDTARFGVDLPGGRGQDPGIEKADQA